MKKLRNKNQITDEERRYIRRLALACMYNDEICSFAEERQIAKTTAEDLARQERKKTNGTLWGEISKRQKETIETIALEEKGYQGVRKYVRQNGIKPRAAEGIAYRAFKREGLSIAKIVVPDVRAEIQRLSLLSPTNEKIYEYASKHGVSRDAALRIAWENRQKFGCQKRKQPTLGKQHKEMIKELALKNSINTEIYSYAQQHNISALTAKKYAARARREAGKLRKRQCVDAAHRSKIQQLARKYRSYEPIREYTKQHDLNYQTAQRIARKVLKSVISTSNGFPKISPVRRRVRRETSEEEKQHIEKLALESPTNERIREYANKVGMNPNTACDQACKTRKRYGMQRKTNKVSLEDKQQIEQMAIEQDSNRGICEYAKKRNINTGTARQIAREARLRAGEKPDENSFPLPEEITKRINYLVLQGKTNQEIFQQMKGKVKRGRINKYARRYVIPQ